MFYKGLIIVIYCCGAIIGDTAVETEVTTNYGKLRGHIASDGNYLAFLGIPYAAPPVGENRFKDPQPLAPWEGVYNATRRVRCPQMGQGDEDCLILNVFTPIEKSNELFPVLFFIHGGRFLGGSGPVDGLEYLIKHDIIVVTINYRVGALGFLCLGIEDAPGNAGLKDQSTALRWVHENIAYFGGNPEEVTLYGPSAGGAAVEHQVLSKMSEGLFRSAIIESGSASGFWATDPEPIGTALELAKRLNIPTDTDIKDLAKEFRSISAQNISLGNLNYNMELSDGTIGLVPCVERPLEGAEIFVAKPPKQILAEREYKSVPLMFIYASMEGLWLRSNEFFTYKERMETHFEEFLPANLNFTNDDIKKNVAAKAKQFYFDNKPINDEIIMEFFYYFGDLLIMNGIFDSLEEYAANTNPVYLMEFAYKGNMGNNNEYFEKVRLPGHGDVNKYAILNKPITNESDEIAVERMSTLIANFVKYGNPSPSWNPIIPEEWLPVGKDQNLTNLLFDNDLSVRNSLDSATSSRLRFWKELNEEYQGQVLPVDPEKYSSSSSIAYVHPLLGIILVFIHLTTIFSPPDNTYW